MEGADTSVIPQLAALAQGAHLGPLKLQSILLASFPTGLQKSCCLSECVTLPLVKVPVFAIYRYLYFILPVYFMAMTADVRVIY